MGYIDPNLFGIVAQIGSVVLLFLVSVFLFVPKKIKKIWQDLFARDKTKLESSGKQPENHDE